MRKLFYFLFATLLTFSGLYSANRPSNTFYSYPPEFENAVQALLRLPEARKLLQQVNREGSISIDLAFKQHPQFDASWDSYERTIHINRANNQKLGTLICSILFELHNAASTNDLVYLSYLAHYNQIEREEYVKNIEWLEHQNALKTKILLEKGIRRGIFPPDAYWSVLHDFEDHYKLQKVQGHTEQLAKHYDRIRRLPSY